MKRLTISSILISFLFMLAACGGGGDSAEQSEGDSADAAADDGVRTVDIVGTDDMRFVVSEEEDGLVTGGSSGQFVLLEAIEASPGEEIRINLQTVSNLPPSAMSHNFALLTLDADTEEFARSSLQAADNDYISPDYEEWVIAATDMLGDGESDTITFTVPDEPGEYDFICTFPGHYSGGMVGKLIVE
ncbi:MAG: plastocyanin/azurin family copper-binding protein [Balneolaceae bacterium]